MGGAPGDVELAEKACLYAAGQAAAVFDLTQYEWGRAVMENVLYAGMPAVFDRVTGKEKGTDDRPLEGAWRQAGLK